MNNNTDVSNTSETEPNYGTVKCSIDGEEWFPINEISVLTCINDYYCADNLEKILDKYNAGEIIKCDIVMYCKN